MLLGAFDRAENLQPQYHYGVEGRLPWVDIGLGLPEQKAEERFDQTRRECASFIGLCFQSCCQRVARIKIESCRNAASHCLRHCFQS